MKRTELTFGQKLTNEFKAAMTSPSFCAGLFVFGTLICCGAGYVAMNALASR